jgi:WD40 repeat protein
MKTIQAVAWHPHQQRIAIALSGEKVASYNLAHRQWEHTSLAHDFQKSVRCLAWAPLSATLLAAGCKHGVCVWKLLIPERLYDSSSSASSGQQQTQAATTEQVESAAWMSFLPDPSRKPIVALAWAPDGEYSHDAHTVLIRCAHTLCSYTVLIHCAHTLCSQLYYTHHTNYTNHFR